MTNSLHFNAGDLWAGLAAAAVILPQAMAFGVALLAPFGIDAASGALAGLIGAASLSLMSGLFGGSRALISAPTGPTLVLMIGAAAALTRTGLEGSGLVTGMAVLMVVTGLFQIGVGLSGGGQLIKFIPYPVVAGFMTGSAVLMIKSQVDPLRGNGAGDAWSGWLWVPPAIAAVTYLAMTYVPKFLPRVPGTIAGLLAGIGIFQFLSLAWPAGVPNAWVVGTIPTLSVGSLGFSMDALRALPWATLVASAAALAVLASVDTLLTAVIADVETRSRHDARRELVGQGAGQILSGLLGGMGGAGTTGATVVAARSGGRRWAGASLGVVFALLVLFLGPVGTLIPISVLAGIILRVAVYMVDRDMFTWLRHDRTRTDGLIALLVTSVTVGYDLMVAVGVGVAIAVVLFVREQVRAPVVHRRSTATETHSVRTRPEEPRRQLDTHGERIVIYELRGNLFFATADRLFEELVPDLDRGAWVILNMRRVSQVDLTGIKILQQISARITLHGGELIFANVFKHIGLGRNVGKTLHRVSSGDDHDRVLTFTDADEALEHAEDALLEELGLPLPSPDTRIPLREMELCSDMDEQHIVFLSDVMRTVRLNAGQELFREGDFGEELFIVVRGDLDIRLRTGKRQHKRLAKCGPGTIFGEVAFLSPGARAADAVAMAKCELLVLDRSGFGQLADAHPHTAVRLLTAIARSQGNYLRWSARELHRLAQW